MREVCKSEFFSMGGVVEDAVEVGDVIVFMPRC